MNCDCAFLANKRRVSPASSIQLTKPQGLHSFIQQISVSNENWPKSRSWHMAPLLHRGSYSPRFDPAALFPMYSQFRLGCALLHSLALRLTAPVSILRRLKRWITFWIPAGVISPFPRCLWGANATDMVMLRKLNVAYIIKSQRKLTHFRQISTTQIKRSA